MLDARPLLSVGIPALAQPRGPPDFRRAKQRIDDSNKFRQQAVAGILYDTPAVLLSFGSTTSRRTLLSSSCVPILVCSHQPCVACDIGGENGGQPAFDVSQGQSGAPNRMGRVDYRLSDRILTVNARAGISFR